MAQKPKVVDGQLDAPYPIESRGDLNRARVLPPPRIARAAEPRAAKPAEKKAPPKAPVDEQPKGGFDYVVKRNRLMKGIRGPMRRGARTARA